jgi:hypothetical protein
MPRARHSEPHCLGCGQMKELLDWARCFQCTRDRVRDHARASYRRRRDQGKPQANAAVARAVRKGVLVRPDFCSDCGCKSSCVQRIHAHHHRGYEPENWLEVEWLCSACHGSRHPRGSAA